MYSEGVGEYAVAFPFRALFIPAKCYAFLLPSYLHLLRVYAVLQ